MGSAGAHGEHKSVEERDELGHVFVAEERCPSSVLVLDDGVAVGDGFAALLSEGHKLNPPVDGVRASHDVAEGLEPGHVFEDGLARHLAASRQLGHRCAVGIDEDHEPIRRRSRGRMERRERVVELGGHEVESLA